MAEDWDVDVLRSTDNFQVDGATIVVQIGDRPEAKSFKIVRSLLANRLPAFSHMMEASMPEPIVVIHNDARDFEDFLWFIHVDPLSFIQYTSRCPVIEKFRRALGIGFIANFYEAADITRWAINELLEHIDSSVTPALLPRLHRFSDDCRDMSPVLHEAVQTAWLKVLGTTPDPVAGLLATKEISDQYLQSHAYFYVLRASVDAIATDARLTTLDRLRLIIGSLNLRRYCQSCSSQIRQANKCTCVPQDRYDDCSLWDLFVQSGMGFNLADDTLDLSFLALPLTIKHLDLRDDKV